jgi:predicted Fe-Mo cluster-binding NifX family protein
LKIAIPTFSPGGLDAKLNPHFGKCECVTLISLQDDEVTETEVILPEGVHSCSTLPTLFAQNKAEACIVGGIGGRPFMFLQQYGIRTFIVDQQLVEQPIKNIIEKFINGKEFRELTTGTCNHSNPAH